MSRKTVIVGLCVMQVLLWITPLFAQVPDTLWTRTFGGSDNDEGHVVRETYDHGYILTGYTRSLTPGLYMIRTDIHGNALWTKVYQTAPLCTGGWSIQETYDGGYIIAGDNGGIWVLKTDSLGDTLWTYSFGGSSPQHARSVIETLDSGFVFPQNSLVGIQWQTGLCKLDIAGNVQWIKWYGRGSGEAIQQTFDGGFIVTGQRYDTLYLRKMNQSGDTIWTKCCSMWPSRGYSVQQTSDGGYIAAGTTGYDVLVVRTDSLGNTIWEKMYGGDSLDMGYSIVQTSDGGYVVVGSTVSFGAGSWDLYVIRADANGDTIWTKTYGGSGVDQGFSVQETHDGQFIITGFTASFGAGGYDVWLLKVTSNVGITNHGVVGIKTNFRGATIASGPLRLPEGKKCKVFDITGRVVAHDKIQPGIYFVEVDGVMTQKMVKVR